MTLREKLFRIWVCWILLYRWWWLGAVFGTTVVLGWFAIQIPIVTTLRDLLPDTTPGIALYNKARARFGGDEAAFVVLGADDHFSEHGLKRLATLTKVLQEHPFVQRVVSPSNAQELWVQQDGTLVIDKIVRQDRTPEQIEAVMLAKDSIEGTLVSKDSRFVLIIATAYSANAHTVSLPKVWNEVRRKHPKLSDSFDPAKNLDEAERLLEISKQSLGTEIVQLAVEAGFETKDIHAAGFTALLSMLIQEANRNLTWTFPLAIVTIIIMLVILLARPLDVMLPLVCIGPAVVWALAFGGFVFERMSLVVTVVPVIVLVVGVSDVVHLVTQYRRELARGHTRDEAICASFVHVGMACLLTSITTLVGFGAMIFLPLPTAQELGVTAGIGVVSAFTLSFVLTPIFLSFTSPKIVQEPQKIKDIHSLFLEWLARYVLHRPRTIVVIGLLSTCLAAVVISFYQVENSLSRKLPPDHPIRQSLKIIEDEFGIASEIEILVDSGQADGLTNPKVIESLNELRRRIEARSVVENTFSILDLLERMHQVMAPDLAERKKLPTDSQQMVAQYLLLFELSGGRDLEAIMDSTKRYARMVVRMRHRTAEQVIAEALLYERWVQSLFPSNIRVSASGIALLSAWLGPMMVESTLQGFLMALGLIGVMVAFLFRSLRVGLLSLIPNIFPIALALICMPLLFEQIDVDTLTFIPVCVGIAVDDTIHFLSRFSIERSKGADLIESARISVCEAGHGMLKTSIILIGGFVCLLWADFQPVATVGLLLPVTLVGALILDLTLLPALAAIGWIDTNIDSKRKEVLSID